MFRLKIIEPISTVMIPSILSAQVRQGLIDFLNTTFPITSRFFRGILDEFLKRQGEAFKGPYLRLGLPFEKAVGDTAPFPEIALSFRPYRHQELAFKRLGKERPESTIVATGTGSGKTESFLLPILHYCYLQRGRPGIKAILIYPMNALATDQAARIARTIHKNKELKGNVTAGIYIGQMEKSPSKTMGPETIISDKETLKLTPPDILLTNYKMLDYLLIRPNDRELWEQNGPETLKFLVVDELHTFDGAQGTDLACLIRRLKARLKTPKGHLCCIGTSATLGTERERKEILSYASSLFGEPFSEGAIIQEERIDTGKFLKDAEDVEARVPSAKELQDLSAENLSDPDDYIKGQIRLWFHKHTAETILSSQDWQLALGRCLKGHFMFQALLKQACSSPSDMHHLIREFQRAVPEIGKVEGYGENLISSLLALVSSARSMEAESTGRKQPFLQVRLEFWMRELRRMVCSVNKRPQLRFADDLSEEGLKTHLPLIHCRECGSTGWAALARPGDLKIDTDLQRFYAAYFSYSPDIRFLFPDEGSVTSRGLGGMRCRICPSCLHISHSEGETRCSHCGQSGQIGIFIPNSIKTVSRGRQISVHDCPYCQSKDSLTILGSRAASLASVEIAQIFSSRFNDHKKLLTFSDSVQDAAHRAGFFTARTWRFNLRAAIQKVVSSAEKEIRLSELPEQFMQYWSEKLPDDEAFVASFIAPNMLWFRDFEAMKRLGRVPEGSRLKEDVARRLSWEITSEFGFNARIGRTLEKTGTSAARPDPAMMQGIVPDLTEMVRNEIGELSALDEKSMRGLIHGLVHHMRVRGAIYHQALSGYLDSCGNVYLISQQHIKWMPNFGPSTRAPAFVAWADGLERFDPLVSPSGRRQSWYEDWVSRCLRDVYPLPAALASRVLRLMFPRLSKEGLLFEKKLTKGPKKVSIWGLRPEALLIGSNCRRLKCDYCGHVHSVSTAEFEDWKGAPCIRFSCPGTYSRKVSSRDYYRQLYEKGDIVRIFAEEHTGLLSREDREEIERQFKAEEDRKPWYPNLLSCTPTLELGIDIGNLSSVILCSVPPAQANYLQRIGRAGRRDGNALNLTLANASNHDLYFFDEPEEMLAGRIEAPGIFLRASAVLERQLTAYCLDRWVESGVDQGAIPPKLGTVLNNLGNEDKRKFPYNFLLFLEKNAPDLLDGFLELFRDDVGPEIRSHLERFILNSHERAGTLEYRILEGLHECKKERESLNKKVRSLSDRIRRKKASKAKDRNFKQDLQELEQEKSALQSLIKQINSKDVLNFFTDDGLIPNYAFPETGVLLRSIIYRRRDSDDKSSKGFESWSYEFERPASAALSELAPDNVFYAGGRRVRIDQVDVALSKPETWRFCSNCSFSQQEAKVEAKDACPRCGSTMWSDPGQKRDMIRMRQVFATTRDDRSRISDDIDERTPEFFIRQMLVDLDLKDVQEAWSLENEAMPFGFEFVSKVTFREVNFGRLDSQGETIVIAGRELPRDGFVICRYCGKIQRPNGQPRHALTCRARKPDSKQNFTDCVYLYREFTSEAIRILIPVTEFWESEKKIHSFVAALQLGLTKRFKGNIDHIHVAIHDEPVANTGLRKKYLVLYDSVPGGTGYLKDLMRSRKPIIELLEMALQKLRQCKCNREPEKDGCYRCLYAYRTRYHLPETSRDTAIALVSAIIEPESRLKRVDNLTSISINPLIESELEALFIEVLGLLASRNEDSSLEKQIINDKPGYFLNLNGQAWYVELQARLGREYGIEQESVADFLFRPARQRKGILPIAVFTDGYAYHQDRIGKDMDQRMAIAKSGRFHVWSLSWKDVKHLVQSQGDFFENFIQPVRIRRSSIYENMLKGLGIEEMNGLERFDSFSLLLKFLASPDVSSWQKYAFAVALLWMEAGQEGNLAREKWLSALPESIRRTADEKLCPVRKDYLFGGFSWPEHAPWLHFGTAASKEAISKMDYNGFSLCAVLDDRERARVEATGFEKTWAGFLRLHNIFQFVPGHFFSTVSWITKKDQADWEPEPKTSSHHEGMEEQWQEVAELTDVALMPFITWLQNRQAPIPEPGYELTDQRGRVIAEAELGWEEARIAILLDEDMEDNLKPFQEQGWTVFDVEEALKRPEKIMEILKK